MKKLKYLIKGHGRVGSRTHVSFIPAETIDCNPPYIAGKKDSCWANVKGVNIYNQEQCERAVGMKLLSIQEEI